MFNSKRRFALAATTSLAVLGATAGGAWAQDTGVSNPSGPFRLNPNTLEPGCYLAGQAGTPISGHMALTPSGTEAHVSVVNGASFSVDQVLIADQLTGYRVFNQFDTGSINNDVDVDPNQTATDLRGLSNALDLNGSIVCVSDHSDGSQNEPYVSDGLPGEVAALNRPIVRPVLSALGVSASSSANTYKAGFGYAVDRGYDLTWRNVFGSGGDPMASAAFSQVTIGTRIKQDGVRRWNDIDEFGEAFSGAVANYGQPTLFSLAGDPFAYLHNQGAGLMTFTTQGDLPITWSLKPSLAPQSYGRSVSITDDMLRAWEASWQNYYAGKGPKPTMPLAPGTNSPAPDPSITVIVNLPESRNGNEAQKPNSTVINNSSITVIGASKATVRMTRLMRTKNGRAVQVFVSSSKSKAHLRIRLYSKSGAKLTDVTKTVATNRFVKVSGLKVAKKAKTAKATLVG